MLLTESQCIVDLTIDLDFLHPLSFLSDISNEQLEFFIQAHLTVQCEIILAICFCPPFPKKLHIKISTEVIEKVRVAQNCIFFKTRSTFFMTCSQYKAIMKVFKLHKTKCNIISDTVN